MDGKLPPICITKTNYLTESLRFKDECLQYGRPGREIRLGKRIPLVEPNADVTLVSTAILGNPAVAQVVVNGVVTVIGVAEVRAVAAVYQCNYDIDAAGQLTSRGHADYRGDLREFRHHLQRDDDHYANLLLFMLRSLSTSSRTTLETKPAYLPLKLATDTFALWELVDAVHIHGSSLSKHRHMKELLSFKQGSSHDEFLVSLRSHASLVLSAFGSPQHPGYIKFDDLLLSVYLNGVDSTFFQRHIDQVLESPVPLTSQDVMERFQLYYLERGPVSPSPSRALIAPATKQRLPKASPEGKVKYGKIGLPGCLGPFVPSVPLCC